MREMFLPGREIFVPTALALVPNVEFGSATSTKEAGNQAFFSGRVPCLSEL